MLINKLKRYIEANDLKKKKVAKMLGVSAGHFSYILNGSREPSLIIEFRIKKLIE